MEAAGQRGALGRLPFLPALAILAALLALNGFAEPGSLSLGALRGLVSTYLALMLLAVAQSFVVFAGDIDLSVGATLSLVNVCAVTLMDALGGSGTAVPLAVLAGLGVGLGCGLLNGAVVAGLRLQPIVATFATSILFTGAALWVLPVAGLPAPTAFWRTYGGRMLGVPFVFYALILLLALIWMLVRRKIFLQLLAVGDDRRAAFQSGLPVTRIRVTGYALSGTFSALAALCVVGDTASGDPLVGGAMTLNSVAAVVLGGTALSGGTGSLLGSLIGALIIGLIASLVFFLGTPSEWQNLVQGLSILLALMVGILVSRRAR